MARHNTPEERQLIELIEKVPLPDEDKNGWIEMIREYGLSEDLAQEIRERITSDKDIQNPARYSTKFIGIIRRWRLSELKKSTNRRF